jgi:adenylate cyclase
MVKPMEARPERMGPRILVVDDEPDILVALRNYLEGALGVEVIGVPSGAAGLQALDEGPIDVIVSDFRMPVMNGVEFLRQARAKHPDTPRILLTAYPDMDLAIRALNDAAIVQFLTKPVDPEKLLEVVQTTMAASRRKRSSQRALERASGLAGRADAPAAP